MGLSGEPLLKYLVCAVLEPRTFFSLLNYSGVSLARNIISFLIPLHFVDHIPINAFLLVQLHIKGFEVM